MRLTFLLLSIFLYFNSICSGQSKYFIYFKDKSNTEFKISEPTKYLSPRSITRRIAQNISIIPRDFPVNKTYVADLKKAGAKVIYTSKWMNAALIEASASQLTNIKLLSFVKGIEGNAEIKGARVNNEYSESETKSKFGKDEKFYYGTSLNQTQQIGADILHKNGKTGKGILIGVFDSGFLNANTLDVFKPLFDEKRVIAQYDFVANNTNVFDDHNHGTSVLSCIVGKLAGKLIGTAPDASVALFRTEDVSSETKLEEINWLLAAEFADSIGVDVINSSLGYNTFDNPAQSYKYEDLNGDKTISAKAADWAVATGMIVVVSAGNEGNTAWKYISTPADADSVITVGAIDSNGLLSSFSSLGPNAKNSIKPELVARGTSTTLATSSNTIATSNGTSFSSPLIAGLMASFKQAYPNLSAMKLREIVIQSGSQFKVPDNRLGYGIPSVEVAIKLADAYVKTLVLSTEKEIFNSVVYPVPADDGKKIVLKINNTILPENQMLEVLGISGQNVFGKPLELRDLRNRWNNLNSSVYMLKLNFEGINYLLKIIK